jgi:hypothetical protein
LPVSDILNFAFCEIARASHSADPRPRDRRPSFSGLTPNRRIAKCRETAAQAERLASYASGEVRSRYIELARQLTVLADEMETALSGTA